MFALRGAAVCFSIFGIVYCVLSLAVVLSWRRFHGFAQSLPVRRQSDLLFCLRILPLGASVALTAAFTVPSFLLLEPRAIDEPLSAVPMLLGIFGAAVAIVGIASAGRALRNTQRAVSAWARSAHRLPSCGEASYMNIPLIRVAQAGPEQLLPPRAVPAMTAVGIIRPRVLLSDTAEALLLPDELRSALRHEAAHIRRRDNLKKLLFRLAAFPGVSQLEAAWLEATELASDEAAVSNLSEALDLAAALIKLSSLAPTEAGPELAAALVAGTSSVISARVQRLLCWTEESGCAQTSSSARYRWTATAMLVTASGFVLTYSHLLGVAHTA